MPRACAMLQLMSLSRLLLAPRACCQACVSAKGAKEAAESTRAEL